MKELDHGQLKTSRQQKGGDLSESYEEVLDEIVELPPYVDPFIETEKAVYQLVFQQPGREYTIEEIASVAHDMGPVDPREAAFSAARSLEALGLVAINARTLAISAHRVETGSV